MNEAHPLFTAAPGQNLPTKQSIERFIPLLVAESLSRIQEYHTGKQLPRIDMWNNFGFKMDTLYNRSNSDDKRYDYSTQLLDQKYDLLAKLGVQSGRTVVRDDDPQVKDFLAKKVKKLVEEGKFYPDTTKFNTCDNCDYVMSEYGSTISACSKCGGKEFYAKEASGLFLDIPVAKNTLLDGQITLPKNPNHIRGILGTLPDRMVVNRVREYGLPLDDVGFQGYVLDPKIGISLLPEYVSQSFGIDTFTQVQGYRTAIHTAPYTKLLAEVPAMRYVFLQRIPLLTLDEVSNLGLDFFARYLPLYLTTRKRDLSQSELISAQISHSKLQRKLDNTLTVLERETDTSSPLEQSEQRKIECLMNMFANYDIADALAALRTFVYDDLSSDYANRFKSSGLSLDSRDVKKIKEIKGLVL